MLEIYTRDEKYAPNIPTLTEPAYSLLSKAINQGKVPITEKNMNLADTLSRYGYISLAGLAVPTFAQPTKDGEKKYKQDLMARRVASEKISSNFWRFYYTLKSKIL